MYPDSTDAALDESDAEEEGAKSRENPYKHIDISPFVVVGFLPHDAGGFL
jgi:hypothetical protein